MLFLCKELVASADDPQMAQNPYILTKLDLDTIRNFDFNAMQPKEGHHDDEDISARYDQDRDDEVMKKFKLQKAQYYKNYPRLKQRASKVSMPSLLELTCNCVEVLRLRNTLVRAIREKKVLETIYYK